MTKKQPAKSKPPTKVQDIENKIIVEDIDLNKLEKKKKEDIVKVAISISIPTRSKDSKSDIFNRIKDYVQGFKNKEKMIGGPTSFKSGNRLSDLPIKEMTRGEILFWSIFKNIVLYKKITSYLSSNNYETNNNGYGKLYYRYDEIIHISWLIENKHYELLKYKVFKSHVLAVGPSKKEVKFTKQEPTVKDGESKLVFFKDIIETIKSVKQHGNDLYEFYLALYENYNRYIIDMEPLGLLSIKSNNTPSFRALITESDYRDQFIPSQTTLETCIRYGFLKGVKLIIEYMKQQDDIITLLPSTIFINPLTINFSKVIKTLVFLYHNDYLSISKSKSEYYHVLIELMKNQKQPEKTKHLLNCCDLITSFSTDCHITINQFNNMKSSISLDNQKDYNDENKSYIKILQDLYSSVSYTTFIFNDINFNNKYKYNDDTGKHWEKHNLLLIDPTSFSKDKPLFDDQVSDIGCYGDVELLDKFINVYLPLYRNKTNLHFRLNLYAILLGAAKFGRLNIFEYLYYKYPNLIIKVTGPKAPPDNQNGLYSVPYFREITATALKHSHLHIVDLIVNKLGVSINKGDVELYPLSKNIETN